MIISTKISCKAEHVDGAIKFDLNELDGINVVHYNN